MEFIDKYSVKEEPNKILISNDAFAIGEMIEELILEIKSASLRFKR